MTTSTASHKSHVGQLEGGHQATTGLKADTFFYDDDSKVLIIPDLFEKLMSREHSVNPCYEDVRIQSLDWDRVCSYDKEEDERLRRGDFAFFAAVSVPDATPEKLKTVVDWLNMMFVFHDQIDSTNLTQARIIQHIGKMLAVLDSSGGPIAKPNNEPLSFVLKDVLNRIQLSACSAGAQRRFVQYMREYLNALKGEVDFTPCEDMNNTIKGYLLSRFHSTGARPLFSFIEYVYDLDIPEEVFDSIHVTEIQRIGVEIQMLTNDCVSYHREKIHDRPRNIIFLLQQHGLGEQQAYDHVQTLLRECYSRWYLTLADVPWYGEKVDRELHQYFKGIVDVALANAHWSFRTERYFGEQREVVRKTRKIVVDKVAWLPSVTIRETAPSATIG